METRVAYRWLSRGVFALTLMTCVPANAQTWTDTRRCFRSVATDYSPPRPVDICLSTLPECKTAIDQYYVMEAKEFGCALKPGGYEKNCPTQTESMGAWPPNYCWPYQFVLGAQGEGAFLPGNKGDYDGYLARASQPSEDKR